MCTCSHSPLKVLTLSWKYGDSCKVLLTGGRVGPWRAYCSTKAWPLAAVDSPRPSSTPCTLAYIEGLPLFSAQLTPPLCTTQRSYPPVKTSEVIPLYNGLRCSRLAEKMRASVRGPALRQVPYVSVGRWLGSNGQNICNLFFLLWDWGEAARSGLRFEDPRPLPFGSILTHS